MGRAVRHFVEWCWPRRAVRRLLRGNRALLDKVRTAETRLTLLATENAYLNKRAEVVYEDQKRLADFFAKRLTGERVFGRDIAPPQPEPPGEWHAQEPHSGEFVEMDAFERDLARHLREKLERATQ